MFKTVRENVPGSGKSQEGVPFCEPEDADMAVRPRRRDAPNQSVPTNIEVISPAASVFSDCPSITAIQLTELRHTNTSPRKTHIPNPIPRAMRQPRWANTPKPMLMAPKSPPDISAVLAFSGFERYPINPTRIRNRP